jgi:hypothetical protein
MSLLLIKLSQALQLEMFLHGDTLEAAALKAELLTFPP